MHYIVFDLEWNQSKTGLEKETKEIPFEIIEIGAVKLDEEFRLEDKFQRFIRPQVYRELHDSHKNGRIGNGKSFSLGYEGVFGLVRGGLYFLHMGSPGFDRTSEEYEILLYGTIGRRPD